VRNWNILNLIINSRRSRSGITAFQSSEIDSNDSSHCIQDLSYEFDDGSSQVNVLLCSFLNSFTVVNIIQCGLIAEFE